MFFGTYIGSRRECGVSQSEKWCNWRWCVSIICWRL